MAGKRPLNVIPIRRRGRRQTFSRNTLSATRPVLLCAVLIGLVIRGAGSLLERLGQPASSAFFGEYFRNCDAARAAGLAPLRAGEPGYRSELDRDGDGVACEPYSGW